MKLFINHAELYSINYFFMETYGFDNCKATNIHFDISKMTADKQPVIHALCSKLKTKVCEIDVPHWHLDAEGGVYVSNRTTASRRISRSSCTTYR
jgi:hypothetical protein